MTWIVRVRLTPAASATAQVKSTSVAATTFLPATAIATAANLTPLACGVCVVDVDGDGICDNVDECVGSVDVLGQCNGACLFDIDADGICDDVDECVHVGCLRHLQRSRCHLRMWVHGLAVGECDCFETR